MVQNLPQVLVFQGWRLCHTLNILREHLRKFLDDKTKERSFNHFYHKRKIFHRLALWNYAKKSARFFILFLNYTELSTAQNRINGIKLNMGPLLTVTVDILWWKLITKLKIYHLTQNTVKTQWRSGTASQHRIRSSEIRFLVGAQTFFSALVTRWKYNSLPPDSYYENLTFYQHNFDKGSSSFNIFVTFIFLVIHEFFYVQHVH